MRYTFSLVLLLLLALSRLAVGSSYSTQGAQQQQDQQQCQQWSSSAAGLQLGLGDGSCPAQLHPFAAEAPAAAMSAYSIAATNRTQAKNARQEHSSSAEGSSRGVSSGSQDVEQPCRGTEDSSWQPFIVRFSEYKMLSEHKQVLGKVSTTTLGRPNLNLCAKTCYTSSKQHSCCGLPCICGMLDSTRETSAVTE
jgi:hypothetical protein